MLKLPAPSTKSGSKSEGSSFSLPTAQLDGNAEPQTTPPGFKRPGSRSPPQSAGSKRDVDTASDGSDEVLFSSQASTSNFKKPRTTYGGNIHAAPKSSFKAVGHGSREAKKRSRTEEKERKFEALKVHKEEEEAKRKAEAGPEFRRLDVPALRTNGSHTLDFKRAAAHCDTSASLDDHSSPLSELNSIPSTPPDLPDVQPYVRTYDCAICSSSVPALIREDFEDTHPQSRRLSSSGTKGGIPISTGTLCRRG